MSDGKETEITIIPKGYHHTEHEVGGLDEIDVTDLTGVLANAQPYTAHNPLVICNTEVFSGNSPGVPAYTALDLSGVVGARAALVILRVYNASGGAANFATRPNGETEVISFGDALKCFSCSIAGGTDWGFVMGLTDAAGILEWYCSLAGQAGTTIDLIGYITEV